jgi:hypothetical protein
LDVAEPPIARFVNLEQAVFGKRDFRYFQAELLPSMASAATGQRIPEQSKSERDYTQRYCAFHDLSPPVTLFALRCSGEAVAINAIAPALCAMAQGNPCATHLTKCSGAQKIQQLWVLAMVSAPSFRLAHRRSMPNS